jgi:hypothetical protein
VRVHLPQRRGQGGGPEREAVGGAQHRLDPHRSHALSRRGAVHRVRAPHGLVHNQQVPVDDPEVVPNANPQSPWVVAGCRGGEVCVHSGKPDLGLNDQFLQFTFRPQGVGRAFHGLERHVVRADEGGACADAFQADKAVAAGQALALGRIVGRHADFDLKDAAQVSAEFALFAHAQARREVLDQAAVQVAVGVAFHSQVDAAVPGQIDALGRCWRERARDGQHRECEEDLAVFHVECDQSE